MKVLKLLHLVATFLTTISLSSCSDKEGAEKTIKHYGFKPIKVGGYAFFSGGQGDFFTTKFKAIDINGDTIEGVVTKGLIFKGSTVRIND